MSEQSVCLRKTAVNKFLLSPLFFLFLCCWGCSPRYTPPQYEQPKRRLAPASPNQTPDMVDLNRTGWSSGKNIIVLDPGHGGDDYGTNSNGNPKFYEKYLNLSTTLIVKAFLEQKGYTVRLTRTNDTFIPLDERAEFANRLGAQLFVSIHYNSAPSKDAEGLEVFYYLDKENATRTEESKRLAKCALEQIIHQTGVKSRGVKQANFAVIRKTDMPAILIEGGFLTNEKEMEKIKTSAYQKQLAQGITHGITDYLARAPLLKK